MGSLSSTISYAATLTMLISTCLTIFVSLSTAKETKEKRSVASYPYPYETNGIYDPPATSYSAYDDYDTSYAVQRQDHRHSNFLQWLIKVFKSKQINRQDAALGGFVSVALPLTALGVLLTFSNEINNLFTTTTTTTAAPVTAFDPCATKDCGTGFTCDGGACICLSTKEGTQYYSPPTSNVCDSTDGLKCGSATACNGTST